MSAIRSFAVAFAAGALLQNVQAWNIDLPACVSPFKPFVYSGCFEDVGPNALSFRSDGDSSNMTVEGCMAECKGNGFRYSGLEYYGICFCGNSVNGAQLDDSQCTFPCSGNKSEICGGNNKLSVYQDTTFLPLDTETVEDYTSLGCYFDDSSLGKALSYPQDSVNGDGLTTESCLTACKAGGYPFAGTEYGGECWCGVVLGNDTYSTPDDCDIPCKGDSSQTCGGRGRLNLYVATDLESLEPCGYAPPASSSSSTVPPTTSSSSSTVPPTTSSTSSTVPPTTSTTSSTTISTSTSTSTSSTLTTTTTSSTTTAQTTTSSTTTTSTTTSSTIKTTTSSTTTKPPTTTPPTTTPKPPTTSTTSTCYTTTTIPSTCEYKCGSWCNDNLPDWQDQTSCKTSHSNCKLQLASCFKNAGWPGSMECFKFADWCSDIDDYCSTSPAKVSKYGKSDCFSKKPPKGNPPTTKTITVPCAPTATTTKKTTTTTPASTTTKCPIPTVTNICKQPTDKQWGYGPGNPVGGIELPVVTCNDLKNDFNQKPFKLYTETQSSKCGSYTRPQCSNACADACKWQYDQCLDTYAQGCKSSNGQSSYWDQWHGQFGRHRRSLNKRTFGWSDNYSNAQSKCKYQYNDCLAENKGVSGSGKCGSYGGGW